jgi:hypothetical protein
MSKKLKTEYFTTENKRNPGSRVQLENFHRSIVSNNASKDQKKSNRENFINDHQYNANHATYCAGPGSPSLDASGCAQVEDRKSCKERKEDCSWIKPKKNKGEDFPAYCISKFQYAKDQLELEEQKTNFIQNVAEALLDYLVVQQGLYVENDDGSLVMECNKKGKNCRPKYQTLSLEDLGLNSESTEEQILLAVQRKLGREEFTRRKNRFKEHFIRKTINDMNRKKKVEYFTKHHTGVGHEGSCGELLPGMSIPNVKAQCDFLIGGANWPGKHDCFNINRPTEDYETGPLMHPDALNRKKSYSELYNGHGRRNEKEEDKEYFLGTDDCVYKKEYDVTCHTPYRNEPRISPAYCDRTSTEEVKDGEKETLNLISSQRYEYEVERRRNEGYPVASRVLGDNVPLKSMIKGEINPKFKSGKQHEL